MVQIYDRIFPLIIDHMSAISPQMFDNLPNQIRKQTLEIIFMVQFPNNVQRLPIAKIVKL